MSARKQQIILAAIIVISIFFRSYNLEGLYSFGWDQERDAQMAWQILNEGKLTLIGPSSASEGGFFLGPLWYYLLLPFYFIAGLDPIAGGYFTIFWGTLTTVAIYFIFKKLLGQREGVVASLVWAMQTDRSPWNPVLIPLFTLLCIYLASEVLKGKKKYIPWIFLVTALALQSHFQAIFLLLVALTAIYFYKTKRKLPTKELSLGVFLALLTLLPLIVFDLRHDFLNLRAFLHLMSTPQHGASGNMLSSILTAYFKLISSLSWLLPIKSSLSGIVVLLVSVLGIFKSRLNHPLKIILLSSIAVPPLLFSFYQGSLSEYYFLISFMPVLMGLSIVTGKLSTYSFFGKVAVAAWLALIFISNFNWITNTKNVTNLGNKKQAVSYIVNQTIDPVFNVSYSSSSAYHGDAGFRYLFKFYGREPENSPRGHLWTIVIPPDKEDVEPLATFGAIGVIRR